MAEFAPGDRVRKKGFKSLGTVVDIGDFAIRIKWDKGPAFKMRPTYCHKNELEIAYERN